MPKTIKAKTHKKVISPSKKGNKTLKDKKKLILEENDLEETPVLDADAVEGEEVEIIELLTKKQAPKVKPVHAIDYIPELERDDSDIEE